MEGECEIPVLCEWGFVDALSAYLHTSPYMRTLTCPVSLSVCVRVCVCVCVRVCVCVSVL